MEGCLIIPWWISFEFRKKRNSGFKKVAFEASLASSAESDDGGVSPPPLKKQRLSAVSTNMQASNGCHNGDTASTSNDLQNGTCPFEDTVEINGDVHKTISTKIRSQTDQDIIRLIGQHLRGLGLKYVNIANLQVYLSLILAKCVILTFKINQHSPAAYNVYINNLALLPWIQSCCVFTFINDQCLHLILLSNIKLSIFKKHLSRF